MQSKSLKTPFLRCTFFIYTLEQNEFAKLCFNLSICCCRNSTLHYSFFEKSSLESSPGSELCLKSLTLDNH